MFTVFSAAREGHFKLRYYYERAMNYKALTTVEGRSFLRKKCIKIDSKNFTFGLGKRCVQISTLLSMHLESIDRIFCLRKIESLNEESSDAHTTTLAKHGPAS
jgi:hypothetical protein